MKYLRLLAVLLFAAGTTVVYAARYEIRFDKPATQWDNALPVGNGRLGAMVFGNVTNERIQLNEESVWAGQPLEVDNPYAKDSLQRIRDLLFEGRYREAEDMSDKYILGNSPLVKKNSGRQGATYQTLGDLYISFERQDGEVTGYERWLDIENALAGVKYTVDGVTYTRQILSSFPDQVIAIRLSADQTEKISATFSLNRPVNMRRDRRGGQERPQSAGPQVKAEGQQITMSQHVGNGSGVTLYTRLMVLPEGGITTADEDGSIKVIHANAVTLLLAAATDYHGEDPQAVTAAQMTEAMKHSYADIREKHIADYRQFFDRMDIDLGSGNTGSLTTDRRMQAAKDGNIDPDLIELYYQFGRYMLISSSRPGTMPGNLQGIWADGLTPPWTADYHININIQMNYWIAGTAALNDMSEPFVQFMNDMLPSARRTASEIYGMKGAMAHFATNAWFDTYPSGSPQWGMWPMGLAWCCQNIWDYYEYGGDKEYLADVSYPIMKEAAVFCMDWLTENPRTGYLVSGPSISPENQFYVPGDGSKASVVMGPTMDHMIIRDLLQNTTLAAKELGVDKKLRKQMRKTLKRLQPTVIGEDGRILEWSEPLEEPEPGHRHISHLYGLYPGNQITEQSSPDLLDAARKTIDYRLSHGGGHTGWSRAWIINFFARLRDGNTAYDNVVALLQRSTLDNLFDTHPPFQIDGNFGASAGIIEMLMQSHAGEIELLPALPDAWPDGAIRGTVARGGFSMDFKWKDGTLTEAEITSLQGNPLKLAYNGQTVKVRRTKPGQTFKVVYNEKGLCLIK